MDNKENRVTDFIENQANLKNYKRDIFFIIIIILLTILFPFQVIYYLWGRFNLMLHLLVIGIFPIMILILIFTFASLIKLITKNIRKNHFLIFIEICLTAIFIIALSLPLYKILNLYESHPFLCGYRDRIRNKIDIETVREWMKTYSENFTAENNNEFIDEYLSPDKIPDCLKPIRHDGVFTFSKFPEGYLRIYQGCGGGFIHWGVTIGMEDIPFPDSQFYNEHGILWLPVAPGVYVDMD